MAGQIVAAVLTFFGLIFFFGGLLDSEGKTKKAGVIAGIVLFLVSFLVASYQQVPAGYRGVLLRFGAVQGVLDEGAHFVVPFVNRVEKIEVRTQKVEVPCESASKDMQRVDTKVAINFHLSPEKVGILYKRLGVNYDDIVITPAVLETVKAVVSKYAAADLVKQRESVKQRLDDMVASRLGAYDITVENNGVSLTDFQFSDEYNAAIESKQVAEQESEKQKYVLSKARVEAQTAITTARGEAEANRIKAKALENKGGQRVLQREWIQRWDGHTPQVVTGNGGGVFITLDKVKNDADTPAPANKAGQ